MRKRRTFLYLSCAGLLALGAAVALWSAASSVLNDHVRPSPAEETANKLLVLETRIRLFAGRNGRLPETLGEAVGPDPANQDLLTDGWGNRIRFDVARSSASDGDAIVSLEAAHSTNPPDRLRAKFRLRRAGAGEAYETEWIVEPWCREWLE